MMIQPRPLLSRPFRQALAAFSSAFWSVAVLAAFLSACAETSMCGEGPCEPCDCVVGCAGRDFESHTRHQFESEAELKSYCAHTGAQVACKTLVTGLAGGTPAFTVLEPAFYAMHDEWFWFHLLNGAPLPDCPRRPLAGMSFATIGAVYESARQLPASNLPLDLGWSGDRLYSTEFYDLTVRGADDNPAKVRHWAPGTLRFHPANAARKRPGALWTFSLEYTDKTLAIDVTEAMATLRKQLPKSVSDNLYWLARSTPWQEALAVQLGAQPGPLFGRCLTDYDLAVPGAFEVVHPGITAGRIRKVPKADLATFLPTRDEIVVLEGVPDDLAPVAGIVTAAPQSAQAHIALLAKARGTPSVYVEGIFDDPTIDAWAKEGRHVLMHVKPGEGPHFQTLSPDDWAQYVQLRSQGHSLTVPTVNPALLPTVWPLKTVDDIGRRYLIGRVGGKAAGFAALVKRGASDTPPDAIALTVKGYAKHITALEPSLAVLLAQPEMRGDDAKAVWWRLAVMEGKQRFLQRQLGSADAAKWLAQLLTDPETLPLVTEAILSGGVQTWVQQQPIDAVWLAAVIAALKSRWDGLSATQGLRFRSSATVEDIDGFSAAGVYSSHTGYLRPWLHPKSGERSKSIEKAIRRVWSAYWRFEAVEERRIAGLDHLKGRMGVLVHPAFGDSRESANGVAVITLKGLSLSGLTGADTVVETRIEGQIGALSVTNPPPNQPHLPERALVSEKGLGAATWQREVVSSESAVVLTKGEALQIHGRLKQLARSWLNSGNARRPLAVRHQAIQLDVEWRRVHADWPEGSGEPARMVFKQARPLGPRPRVSELALEGKSAPGDLLAAALSVQRVTCNCGPQILTWWLVQSDPAWPLWPYATTPFVAHLQSKPSPGTTGGQTSEASHLELVTPSAQLTPLHLSTQLITQTASQWGSHTIDVQAGGACTIDGKTLVHGTICQLEPLQGGPESWLLSLVAQK